MKRTWLLVCLALCACGGPDVELAERRAFFADQARKQSELQVSQLESKSAKLKEEIQRRGLIVDGKTPVHILKIEIHQSHFSLNPMTHIKDAANAFEFEIPVTESFYDSAEVGKNLQEKFRAGSFFLSGSIGDWNVRCTGKRIAAAP